MSNKKYKDMALWSIVDWAAIRGSETEWKHMEKKMQETLHVRKKIGLNDGLGLTCCIVYIIFYLYFKKMILRKNFKENLEIFKR